ncbi:MAG: hypothetical protein PHD74_06865, partial [Candidatus Krumholzibacteria bacterium]|nr:hypothetical protein [Candidatus Krumholzibacteria bacterium]
MTGEERGKAKNGSCDAVEGGYTIFIDEERMRAFMDNRDFSSASELGHFKDAGAQIEKRIKERSGAAFLALSVGEKGLSRDFAVLQIAHSLAQHGKSVLIVDCDFLHPGLSGLVENIEEHGFLDLLLYGSSLKTVAHSIGIEGVSVTGPGSFPVSRTIPFALREFEKIREFVRAKHDVVIYCSTLYTEDAKVNPLAGLVDGIVLCCRIEDMSEGELQRNLKVMGGEKVPPIELVCFCGKGAQAPVSGPAPAKPAESKVEPAKLSIEAPRGEKMLPVIPAAKVAEEPIPSEAGKGPRVSMLRVAGIGIAILFAAFIIWWAAINRTVRESKGRGTPSPAVVESNNEAGTAQRPGPAGVRAESLAAVTGSDTSRGLPQAGTAEQTLSHSQAVEAGASPAGST